jgi:putative hydrolase of the HAD superfamily
VPKIGAVFLDAGDTLLAADPPVDHVYRDAFAVHGVDVHVDDVHGAVRATWREVDAARERGETRWGGTGGEVGFWRRFVGSVYARVGGGEMPEALLAGLIAHFRQELSWTLYPEVPAALSSLREMGLKLSVVSNWDSSLPSLLARLGLGGAFDDVIASAAVGVSKPDRGIFDEALRRADVEAGAALHVGDSLVDDYGGAIAAGLHALLVDRRGRAPDGFERIGSLAEIPAWIRAR